MLFSKGMNQNEHVPENIVLKETLPHTQEPILCGS